MRDAVKLGALAVLILVGTGIVAGAEKENQNAGIGQKVDAEVERTDYTIHQTLRVYCKYYNVDFCEDKITPFNVFRTLHHYLYVDAEAEQEWSQ